MGFCCRFKFVYNNLLIYRSWQQAERQTMEYNKYKIEDINIGDEIYFDSVPSQSNFDEYWTVHGKDNNQVLVNLKKEHYWTVKISEIRQHIKKPMNDNKS